MKHCIKRLLSTLYVVLLGASATVSEFAQQTNISTTEQSPRFFLHVFSEADMSGTNLMLPSLILTTNIQFGVVVTRRSVEAPHLCIYIEARDGKYFLHTYLDVFDIPEYQSEIEPEKPFSPSSHPMPGAVNELEYFVLSTNSDYKPFLESLRSDLRSALSRAQK